MSLLIDISNLQRWKFSRLRLNVVLWLPRMMYILIRKPMVKYLNLFILSSGIKKKKRPC